MRVQGPVIPTCLLEVGEGIDWSWFGDEVGPGIAAGVADSIEVGVDLGGRRVIEQEWVHPLDGVELERIGEPEDRCDVVGNVCQRA